MFTWIKLARLQFYPMGLITYSLGAVLARHTYKNFDQGTYWLGYVIIFLIQLMTVFANEYYDMDTDRHNKNAGIFNGGSRMIVNGEIQAKTVKIVIYGIFTCVVILGIFLMLVSPAHLVIPIGCLIATGLILGPGYTVPPLKLCYRGWGEVTVAFMFSLYLILCGYGFQCGQVFDGLPWLISIPLFFSIIPSIAISAIPDIEADAMVCKRTMAVRFGAKLVFTIAAIATSLAALAWVALFLAGLLHKWWMVAVPVVLLHAGIALVVDMKAAVVRGNREILVSISYILWFGLIPLLMFLDK